MTNELEIFVQEVRDLYHDVVDAHIMGGRSLLQEFERVVEASLANQDGNHRQLTERVNELAVAKVLIDDPDIDGPIAYEPDFLPDNRKIDFVVDREQDRIYVEVKTVHPRTVDTEEAWRNYLRRRKLHPENVNFIVNADWMGGAMYGNTYASRQHFLDYTLMFESRLAAAKLIANGPGTLVFCGNGFAWNDSDLEDFADFYRCGVHRQDDPFAIMEQHHIDETGLEIDRNVDYFAYLKRSQMNPEKEEFIFPVMGPRIFGPRVV